MTEVRSELKDGVLHLVLDRPERKNAINQAMYAALAKGLNEAALSDEVRVCVLRGEGGIFTAGNDLKDFQAGSIDTFDGPVVDFLWAIAGFTKPLIACVEGAAIGIGATLLLHCDLVYAAEGTTLQYPFVNLGVCPEAASSLLLPAAVGHHRAAELLFFGDGFTAERALELGLVNEVLPAEGLLARVQERADSLADKPLAALVGTKRLLKHPRVDEVHAVIKAEGELFVQRMVSPEAAEAFVAFFEKRAPDFRQFS